MDLGREALPVSHGAALWQNPLSLLHFMVVMPLRSPFPAVPAHFKLLHAQGNSAVLSHDPHEPKCKMTEFPTMCLSGNLNISNPGLKERGIFYALAEQSLLPLLQPLIAP